MEVFMWLISFDLQGVDNDVSSTWVGRCGTVLLVQIHPLGGAGMQT